MSFNSRLGSVSHIYSRSWSEDITSGAKKSYWVGCCCRRLAHLVYNLLLFRSIQGSWLPFVSRSLSVRYWSSCRLILVLLIDTCLVDWYSSLVLLINTCLVDWSLEYSSIAYWILIVLSVCWPIPILLELILLLDLDVAYCLGAEKFHLILEFIATCLWVLLFIKSIVPCSLLAFIFDSINNINKT